MRAVRGRPTHSALAGTRLSVRMDELRFGPDSGRKEKFKG